MLARLHADGQAIRQIVASMVRAASTISREPKLFIRYQNQDPYQLEGADFEKQIAELAEKGEVIEAIIMVRLKYGYTRLQKVYLNPPPALSGLLLAQRGETPLF